MERPVPRRARSSKTQINFAILSYMHYGEADMAVKGLKSSSPRGTDNPRQAVSRALMLEYLSQPGVLEGISDQNQSNG